jgi:hypothetical protein
MNRNLLARSIAVLLLGILFGWYINYDQRKTRQMSREQHLASEARKFDESISNPTPAAAMVVGGIIVLGAFVFLYEIVTIGVSAVLKSMAVGAEKTASNANIPFT